MQQTSPTPPPLVENFQILPMSITAISDVSTSNDTQYSSVLLKKKLAMLDHASKNTSTDVSISNDTIANTTPVSLIKPSSTTLSINENEPVKSASRRRKPLRPWSLSARGERPNSNYSIEPISDNDDDNNNNNQIEMKSSPVNNEPTNSNHEEEEEEEDIEWPKYLSTIEEILKLYRVETNGLVQCIRCGSNANQDNLLEHVSIHYPYKCYSCGFYCDSSLGLDEHNQTHPPNTFTKLTPEQLPMPTIPTSTSIKSTEIINNHTNNSEKSTPPSKAKVHRCRQCSFVSGVKEDYWAHHRVHIRADKILECPSCPFVTEYKHHLEYHLRNHLGSKPFKCSKCDYACVNLSMLRSHKKSHYRHLLFKCSNCSFESKQYQALQEHLQIEGHEPYVDENIEEFLKEYSNGNLNHMNSSSPPPSTQKNNSRQPTSKKRKTAPTTTPVVVKRTSSTSSIGSSAAAMSPISNDEHQTDSINQQTTTTPSTPLVCSLCDYVAASKEGLGVHLFQHACKKSDLLNRSLLASATVDPATKLMELFNGKMGPFNNGQLNDFIAPYQQFLTQQIQSHLSSASSLSSTSTGVHSYHLDSNNNHTPPTPSLLNGGYSLLSSCIKNESNENHLPSSKFDHHIKRQRKTTPGSFKYSTDGSNDEHSNDFINRHDQQTQVDECQIKRLFECFHCEIIFKDFAMYCTHKQLHYSPDNPFRCAQCGEQKANKYDFFVHVAQQAHELT
jgi:hunchback-like protein